MTQKQAAQSSRHRSGLSHKIATPGSRRTRLWVEPLETRLAPACTMSGLTVSCDGANDNILVVKGYEQNRVDYFANSSYLGSTAYDSGLSVTINGGGGSNSLTYQQVEEASYSLNQSPFSIHIYRQGPFESKLDLIYSGINNFLQLDVGGNDGFIGYNTDVYIYATAARTIINIESNSDLFTSSAVRVYNGSESSIGELVVSSPDHTANVFIAGSDADYEYTVLDPGNEMRIASQPNFKLRWNDLSGVVVSTGAGNDRVDVDNVIGTDYFSVELYDNDEVNVAKCQVDRLALGSYANSDAGNYAVRVGQEGNTLNDFTCNTYLADGGESASMDITYFDNGRLQNGGVFDGSNLYVDYFNPVLSGQAWDGILNSMTINLMAGNDVFRVDAVSFPSIPTTTLNTGPGDDIVTVDTAIGLDMLVVNGETGANDVIIGIKDDYNSIYCPISVQSTGGQTSLSIFDDNISLNKSASLSANALTGLYAEQISWVGANLNFLLIGAGQGNDVFTVENTPGGVTTELKMGLGNDDVNVRGTTGGLSIDGESGTNGAIIGSSAPAGGGTLNTINGAVAFANTGGQGYVYIRDADQTQNKIGTLYADALTGFAPAQISWSGANLYFLRIIAGSGNDVFTVINTPSGFTTDILAGPGNDDVNVRETTGGLFIDGESGTNGAIIGSSAPAGGGTLNTINGPITFANTGSQGYMYIRDADQTQPKTMSLTGSGISGFAPAPISWTNDQLSTLYVIAGAGNDRLSMINHLGGFTTTILMGGGDDEVNVQVAPTAVTIDSEGGDDTVNIGGNIGLGFVSGQVEVMQSSGTDRVLLIDRRIPPRAFTVNAASTSWSPGGGTLLMPTGMESLTILAGKGDDSFVLNGAPSGTTTILNAGAGNNVLTGPNATTTWTLSGTNSGTIGVGGNTVTFKTFPNLVGGASADVFKFTAGAVLTGAIDGGTTAQNTLDYVDYTSNVLVNLKTGKATGTVGISRIQKVYGANGGPADTYNILIGNGGASLFGGTGRRNLLVSGASPSALIGGTNDDILIGGTTVYDSEVNFASFTAIMNYWIGGASYATRVANITSGNGVPALNATKVTSNGGGNTLTGAAGLDLFFGKTATDTNDWNSGTEAFVTV